MQWQCRRKNKCRNIQCRTYFKFIDWLVDNNEISSGNSTSLTQVRVGLAFAFVTPLKRLEWKVSLRVVYLLFDGIWYTTPLGQIFETSFNKTTTHIMTTVLIMMIWRRHHCHLALLWLFLFIHLRFCLKISTHLLWGSFWDLCCSSAFLVKTNNTHTHTVAHAHDTLEYFCLRIKDK